MSKFSKFIPIATVLVCIPVLGVTGQVINDRTMENCVVEMIPAWDDIAPVSGFTSCGIVYIGTHKNNGLTNFGAIQEMKKAVRSGEAVDIKATGWPFASAYEITISE